MKDLVILGLTLWGLGTCLAVAHAWQRVMRQREDPTDEQPAWIALAVLAAVVCIVIAAIGFVAVYGNA